MSRHLRPLAAVALLVVLMLLLMSTVGSPSSLGAEPRILPGHVTSEVHPGDPLQEIVVAGFATRDEAIRFVAGGFATTAVVPKLMEELSRGRTVSFAGASFLVFYHVKEGRPALLALVRAHADLHLIVGSCGYQMTLGVRTSASAVPAPSTRDAERRER